MRSSMELAPWATSNGVSPYKKRVSEGGTNLLVPTERAKLCPWVWKHSMFPRPKVEEWAKEVLRNEEPTERTTCERSGEWKPKAGPRGPSRRDFIRSVERDGQLNEGWKAGGLGRSPIQLGWISSEREARPRVSSSRSRGPTSEQISAGGRSRAKLDDICEPDRRIDYEGRYRSRYRLFSRQIQGKACLFLRISYENIDTCIDSCPSHSNF